MKYKQVYLSLGGNQGDVLGQLNKALHELRTSAEVFNLKHSHFYATSALNTTHPSLFVNMICSFETLLSPVKVFECTQIIEKKLGKQPKPKNADRPIDIDIIFYDQQQYCSTELEIPHPRWQNRLFVLVPLRDLIAQIWLEIKGESFQFKIDDLIKEVSLKDPGQAIRLLEKNIFLNI